MKNKNLANKMIAAVFLAFLLAAGLKHYYKQELLVELFFSVTEAALIGGVADWFAITALFKKPLGFTWHTELIPRHREKVIRSIRDVIVQELLTVQSLKRRVENSRFVTLLIQFVENKKGQDFVKGSLDRFCKETISKLDAGEVVIPMESFIRKEISNMDIRLQIRTLVKWLLENDRARALTLYAVEKVVNQLDHVRVKQSFYQYMEDIIQVKSKSPLEKALFWMGEQTNSISLKDAADAFYTEIMSLLEELKNPDHKVHQKIYEYLTVLEKQPEFDFLWLEQAEEWKLALASQIKLRSTVSGLIENVLKTADASLYPLLLHWFTMQMERYWQFFKANEELQEWLELRIKRVLCQLIEREHPIIGDIVQRVLNEFTNERLNLFVEEKAGEDLQWIRINGSIVGGIIGFLLFFFMWFFSR